MSGHPERQRLAHSSESSLGVALMGFLPLSHASHACAAGRHLLRLSMCARRFAPNAHASLCICLPAHTTRTLYVVTPPDAPRSGRQFLRLAMPVQVLRTSPATARCALVSPAALLGAVCSHAFRRAAAGRYSLRLTMPACVLCTPCRHSSLREIPPCGAARRSSLSSANTLPVSAPGGGRVFAPE